MNKIFIYILLSIFLFLNVCSKTLAFEGKIYSIESNDFYDIDYIELINEKQVIQKFKIIKKLDAHFAPSHMKEHMLNADNVIVEYKNINGEKILDTLEISGH